MPRPRKKDRRQHHRARRQSSGLTPYDRKLALSILHRYKEAFVALARM